MAPLVTIGCFNRVLTVFKHREHFLDLWMINRFACFIGQKVLFRDIGHIVAGLILSEEMIKWLVFFGAIVFRNGVPPFFSIRKHRIDIKDHAPKRVDPMLDNLSDTKFGRRVNHQAFATR